MAICLLLCRASTIPPLQIELEATTFSTKCGRLLRSMGKSTKQTRSNLGRPEAMRSRRYPTSYSEGDFSMTFPKKNRNQGVTRSFSSQNGSNSHIFSFNFFSYKSNLDIRMLLCSCFFLQYGSSHH